jgi:N-acyl-D-amino-acid deacylase
VAFSTGLSNLFPLWSRDGGTEAFLRRLADPESRDRIRDYVESKVNGLGSWDAVMISSVRHEEDKQYQGKTIEAICHTSSLDPFEFAVELLRREGGSVGMVGFGMDEAGTEKVLAWSNTMVASDGGAYSPSRPESTPHPRCYGTFPRAIALYQRERNVTTLPDMIRKMTHLPAQKLGLTDRGRLAPEMAADLVVFDYGSIRDRATFENPHQFPDGISFVIVNGVPVVDGGMQTSALPGHVLRRS